MKANRDELIKSVQLALSIIDKHELNVLRNLHFNFSVGRLVAFNRQQGVVANLPILDDTDFLLDYKDSSNLLSLLKESNNEEVELLKYNTSLDVDDTTFLTESAKYYPDENPHLIDNPKLSFVIYLPSFKHSLTKPPKGTLYVNITSTGDVNYLFLNFLDKDFKQIESRELFVITNYVGFNVNTTFQLKLLKPYISKMRGKELQVISDKHDGKGLFNIISNYKFIVMPLQFH